jgi:peptidoglycan hydrolase-like protein with peptidoglycan-binding domain
MPLRLKLFRSALAFGLCAGGLAAMTPAYAQTAAAPSPTAPVVDPAQDAAKRAFEALPEADRVAIQDGLIWTGDYKGIADGKFGKGTRDAIAAFATRNKFPADGTLDAKGRAALAAAATKAKDTVNFSVKADERTGVRIGLPQKLLTKAKPLASGTRYSSADESFSVETTHIAGAAPLQDSFNAAIADAPGRKVTYKVLRPDFFVVTGEAGASTFYTRMTRGERGLAGFTITYPASAKARLDPVSIAIANSFVAFPEAAATAPAPTAGPNASLSASPSAPAVANPALPNVESGAAKPVLTASGIAIAPGLILTSLPKTCSEPLVGTKKAKVEKQDDADGLTLLSLPGAPAASLPLRVTDPASPAQVVILSFVPHTNADELTGASGDFHKAEATGAWRLLAPLQSPVAGAAIFDRSGALAGLVPLEASLGRPIAGVLPQMNRAALPATKLASFLGDARPKPAEHADPRTAGEIVAMGRPAMVPIYCPR